MAPDPYIRFRDPDDGGLRPPDASLYTTPAISINKPTGPLFSTDPAVAYAGVDGQSIRVEVGNRGDADAQATVTVWACGFGVNSGPHGYALTLGGVLGEPRAIEIPAHTVGSGTAVTIPWKPQAGELGGATELHCCIRANVFIDAADQEPDPTLPANTPPDIDIHTNIRHAQRNMTLLAKPPGAMFMFALAMANADLDADDDFVFEVTERRGMFEANEVAHLRRTSWVDPEFPDGLVLPGTDGTLELAPARRDTPEFGLQLGRESGTELQVRLGAGEEGTVTLEFDPGEEDAAEVRRFDIVQRRGERQIGGARVMTVAVPEALLERSREQRGA